MANDGSLVFSAEIDTQQLKRQIAELEKITINLDGTVDMTKVKKTVESTTFSKVELDVAADVSGAEKDVAALKPDDIEIKVDADTTGADEAFDELEKKSGKLKSFFTDGLKSAGEKLLPDDAFELISDLVKGVTDVAKAGDEVDKSSQKMGISRQSYQEWGYVLERNGASTKDLQSGLKSLNGVVSKAESGNREAIKQFSKLGIEFKDISKMSREDIFETVITGLQGIDDEGEKAALATAMFGDSAIELLPTLNQTASETEALKKEAHALGVVMSDDTVSASVELNDNLGKMQSAWEGLSAQLMTTVMPLFTGLFNVASTVIGGVNSLFSSPSKNELSTEIQGAIDKLDACKTSIKDIKNNYATQMVEIEVKYKKSEDLIEDLKALQAEGTLTEEQVMKMQEVSASLLELYPGLKQYVGEDGIIHKEADEVLGLIGAYASLERQRAYYSMVSQIEADGLEGQIQLALLQKQYDIEKAKLDSLSQDARELNAFSSILTKQSLGSQGRLNPIIVATGEEYTLDSYLNSVQRYLDMGKDINALDLSKVDRSLLFNDGILKSADEIERQKGAVTSLYALVREIANTIILEANTQNEAVTSAQANTDAAKTTLDEYTALLSKTGTELEAAKAVFEEKWNVNYDELKSLVDGGMALDDALVKLGATSQGVVDDLNGVSKAGQEVAESGEKIYGIGNKTADAIDELRENASKTGAMTGEVLDAAGNLQATALTVEQLAANIQVAQEAGATAQADLAARKETVVADAQAILTSMNDLIAALALDVDTMVTTMNTIVTNGEVGAATAGNAFAQGAGDGYRANTALRDAVGASAQQSLAALNSYANAFETAGSGLVGSIASGVTGNASVLSDAVRDAVRGALAAAQSAFSGNSVFRTASRYYPHRTGLEYVPYDEYPALLHKGESVLTASEAALWRGGLYVREPLARPA